MNGTVKIALWAVGLLLLFGAIGLVGLNSQNKASNGSTDGATSVTGKQYPSATHDDDVATTITYTGKGFEPDIGSITVNNTVRIRNRSVRLLKFVSDPYPTQNAEPELNVGEVKPGESKTFYISQKGTWGYHNALDPQETGQLIVR